MNPRFLITDTETNKLPDYKLPADHPDQPRLAELGLIWLDESDVVVREYRTYIKPDGWTMLADAAAVNHLNDELLMREGIPVVDALAVYTEAIDAGWIVSAYNAQFDCKVMRGELRLAGLDDRFLSTPNTCTMRGCAGLGIKKANGKGGSPQLADAHFHFTGQSSFEGEHSALGDARAALAVHRGLVQIGKLIEPQVHFAKDKGDKPVAPSAATVARREHERAVGQPHALPSGSEPEIF